MKKTIAHVRLRELSLVLVICILMSLFCTAAFASGNEAVSNASNGVFLLNVEYTGDTTGESQTIGVGTCFLINSNTVVTANHVLDTSDIVTALAASTGRTEADVLKRLSYSITISRDITYPITLAQNSEEMDFAILNLQDSIQTANQLTMRHSSEVQPTEKVYAIGFPELVSTVQDINTYTAGDVTITEGAVQKVLTGVNATYATNADFIQTSCKLTHGISGGPMVDEDGYVVGICQSSWGEDGSADDYFYAVCIDQVLTVCDSLGIEYTLAGATDPVLVSAEPSETPAAVDVTALSSALEAADQLVESDYTATSWAAVQSAKLTAQEAMGATDQTVVDNAAASLQSAVSALQPAEEENTGNSNLVMYIILGAVALIVIIVVILIVALNSKKKKGQSQSGNHNTGTVPPYTPPAPRPTDTLGPTGGTTGLTGNGKATETVMLEDDTDKTSLLINGGTLIRQKTKARIMIDQEEFIIGREQSKVAYCVSDNTSVGRVHAKLVVRDGVTYIVDLESKNGTFVNGVKCIPGKEKQLKSGDKIKLADEMFEFEA